MSSYLTQGVSSGSVPNSWVDSTGSTKDTLNSHPNLQYNIQNLPTVMPIDTDYSYFYKWIVTSDINVVYGKDGNPSGYCGGTTGNRKLFSYSQVTTIGGNCYLIPTSVQKSVECCSNEDCKYNPSKPICDTSIFSCSDKKPCNSDIECQVPGQTSACSNKIETTWKCDTNQKWYPYAGTCTQTTTSVQCCSDSECGAEQYCNKQQGCLDKYVRTDCPASKCCKSGGNYKEKSCGSGLVCCPTVDPIIGDCKQSCETTTTIQALKASNSAVGTDMTLDSSIFIFIILIVCIGGAGYYFWQRYNKNPHKTIETKEKSLKRKGKFCISCGAVIKGNIKFCTKCGKKV